MSKSLNAAFAITKTVSAVLGDSQTWRKSSHPSCSGKTERTKNVPYPDVWGDSQTWRKSLHPSSSGHKVFSKKA